MNIEQFNLLGHSFGGYISSKYALAYPEHVERLIMLSPFATEDPPVEINEKLQAKINDLPWYKRHLFGLFRFMFKNNSTPFSLARKGGRFIGGYVITKALKSRLESVPEEEFPDVSDYMHQIVMMDGSSEYAFPIMFEGLVFSDTPIIDSLHFYEEHKIPITFCFGDEDWMNTTYKGSYVSNQLKEMNKDVFIIESSGHHVYFDNPEKSCDFIIASMEM